MCFAEFLGSEESACFYAAATGIDITRDQSDDGAEECAIDPLRCAPLAVLAHTAVKAMVHAINMSRIRLRSLALVDRAAPGEGVRLGERLCPAPDQPTSSAREICTGKKIAAYAQQQPVEVEYGPKPEVGSGSSH